ncbi:MAG TPA: GNAT family protein, partial [Phototrophicaceae bacterium]|nr:GNAT family protein [Phototrophicaceae bacterium]
SSGKALIREAVPDDAAQIVRYMERIINELDNGIIQSPGELRNEEQERQRIEEHHNTENMLMIVAVTGDNQIIGLANYHGGQRQANTHNAGLGITVHQDWRNSGIGTMMMQYLIDHACRSGIIQRLELEVFTHNARAIHVYHKLGFQFEGTRRKAFFRDGHFVDAHIMAFIF